MSLIKELFGKSPFGPLVEHAKKVHACAKLVKPLLQANINEDYEEVHRLQDEISRLEYEADTVKHEVREHLPRRYFLPVGRDDLERFLHCQDNIADEVQDLAIVLLIRKTRIHPDLREEFMALADQVLSVTNSLMEAAEEMEALAKASFSGVEAKSVIDRIAGVSEGEWMADRLERKLAQHVYQIEQELDPITIMFYEKILLHLAKVANAAENTADMIRQMIVKG